MYGIAFDNMILHNCITLWLMNELKLNSLIYFYDIVFNDIVFLHVIFTYKEIQIKYLFSNNQPIWIDTCIVI